MNRYKKPVLFSAAVLIAVAVAITLLWLRPTRDPITVTCIGLRKETGLDEAVLAFSNRSTATLRCQARVSATRMNSANDEIFRTVDFTISGRSGSGCLATVPRGEAPVLVSCAFAVVGQHSPWVRNAGTFLDRVGIHVYHTGQSQSNSPPLFPSGLNVFSAPSLSHASSPLSIQLGGKQKGGGLSASLILQLSTNYWLVK